ncbi:MAG: S8 family serine peptidase, partial [Solobacterium sp.]|nr:S8 family serine peptidase [Solobacterium sp.]
MVGKKLKQKLCIAGAFGMLFLSFGITPIHAEDDTETETVIDPAADHTEKQYYFDSQKGITVPGWSSKTANVSADEKIVVAVVGSGVDYNHDDLKNVMWNEGDTVEPLKTMGGGRYGYNADGITADDNTVNHDDPMDLTGEGTQTAGILAAEWNTFGISGALSGARIMAVKATGSNTAAGLKYVLAAKKAGINVAAVSLSLTSCTSETENLITELGKAGVITVIAAGDQGKNIDSGKSPAAALRNNPYVIAVGATDQNKGVWEKSNYGTLNVDILAPGADILTTDITKAAENEDETADST